MTRQRVSLAAYVGGCVVTCLCLLWIWRASGTGKGVLPGASAENAAIDPNPGEDAGQPLSEPMTEQQSGYRQDGFLGNVTEDQAVTFTLCVTDKLGTSVPGAMVEFVGTARPVQTTNAAGETVIQIKDTPDSLPIEIEVSARHFRTVRARCPVAPGSKHVLALPWAGTIRGTVVYRDDNPVGSDVIVLAANPLHLPDFADYGAEDATEGKDIARAITDSTGGFELSGLRVGEGYVLYAGGRGYAALGSAKERLFCAEAEGVHSPVRLEVRRLLALDLRFCDQEGDPISLPGSVGGLWYPNPRPDPAEGKMVVISRPIIAAASGDPFFFESRRTRSLGVIHTYEPANPGANRLPVHLECTIPGYEPVEVELMATPLAADLAATVVNLVDRGLGQGDLAVDLGAWGDEVQFEDRYGLVTLKPAQGGSLDLFLNKAPNNGSRFIFRGLPAQVYQVSYTLPAGQLISGSQLGEMQEIEIVNGKETEIQIPRPGQGEVTFQLFDEYGKEYVANATVVMSLVKENDFARQISSLSFSLIKPPYRIAGLMEGTYIYRFLKPLVSYEDVDKTMISGYPYGIFRIEDGSEEAIHLTLGQN